jgi:gliding motility-associated-like protein
LNGNGNYEFRLNNGQWQSNNIFENLDINIVLEFEARQTDLCSTTAMQKVTTLKYRDYFTPNADGFNDYWNIEGLRLQPNAKIYIFDRYGKLLEEISPLQIGWDGTYNGKLMPSQDYWFRVEFIDPSTGLPAIFTDRFTLKR